MNAKERFERLEKATDLPLALLALLIVPALILEERATSTWLRDIAVGINWIVWLAFCAEYVGKLALAPNRRQYVQEAWFDLVLSHRSAEAMSGRSRCAPVEVEQSAEA